ncbi:amidohydrolase [Arenicella chitinivorans]|uniref:Amidohydrolase n=1 Tax=Arenicella chitinivorans TaxID=1329800 RepID=A0A918RNI9_9GAMM|nr:amidohydrolase [Arenicella chitinivorans]GHA06851.1 amidohydrolase [Arenicella chitinivorans]
MKFCLRLTFLLLISLPAKAQVTVVTNATIYTVDQRRPVVSSFAYQNDKIIAVGNEQALLATYQGAQQLDLNGATVVPGFIDAHGHLLGLGQSLSYANLMGTESKQEIIAALKISAQSLPEGAWLLGRGWDQNDWPEKNLPTAADLNAAFPNRPVWLERVDGHASWGNDKAMGFATRDLNGAWQPEGGEIIRDEKGNATGVFIDNAAQLIQVHVPVADQATLAAQLKLAMAKTAEVGLTAMHDAGTSLQVWHLLESLQQEKQLKVRVYAMADGANQMLNYLCEKGPIVDPSAMLSARAIKLYSDGALGSRGAALLADYSDAPGNKGLLIESEQSLTQHATRAAKCGLQVNIHAIGDRGNQVTLNVLEAATKLDNPGRHRIEHSQIVAQSDFARFKQLALIASVQPTHATSDMYWAEDRVGAERIKGAYAWQRFLELGIPLALGSDFPVERPEPLEGFYAAVARQDAKGWPDNGWYAEQSLTREEALYGFTLGAAYAAFQEDKLGSISVGKQADFVVLSQDIMQIPVDKLLETKVKATYLNGQAIYQSE